MRRCSEYCPQLHFWQGLRLIDSPQILSSIWGLVVATVQEYPEVSAYDLRHLSSMMDFMLDQVYRKGDKNLFFTPNIIVRLMVDIVRPSPVHSGIRPAGAVLSWHRRYAFAKGNESLELYGNDVKAHMINLAKSVCCLAGRISARYIWNAGMHLFRMNTVNRHTGMIQGNMILYCRIPCIQCKYGAGREKRLSCPYKETASPVFTVDHGAFEPKWKSSCPCE